MRATCARRDGCSFVAPSPIPSSRQKIFAKSSAGCARSGISSSTFWCAIARQIRGSRSESSTSTTASSPTVVITGFTFIIHVGERTRSKPMSMLNVTTDDDVAPESGDVPEAVDKRARALKLLEARAFAEAAHLLISLVQEDPSPVNHAALGTAYVLLEKYEEA